MKSQINVRVMSVERLVAGVRGFQASKTRSWCALALWVRRAWQSDCLEYGQYTALRGHIRARVRGVMNVSGDLLCYLEERQ